MLLTLALLQAQTLLEIRDLLKDLRDQQQRQPVSPHQSDLGEELQQVQSLLPLAFDDLGLFRPASGRAEDERE